MLSEISRQKNSNTVWFKSDVESKKEDKWTNIRETESQKQGAAKGERGGKMSEVGEGD